MGARRIFALAAVACTAATATAGLPVDVPFTEDFDAGVSNWRDADGNDALSWFASGGPDGGAYASTTYTVPPDPPPFGAIVFRGHDEFDSSDDAFVGDWIGGGVSEFSFWVRHDAPGPIDIFARFATSANFPGAAGIVFAPIAPNAWTLITIDIAPDSPQIILEGSSFEDVFTAVGNVQIGLNANEFIGETFTVDLDKVAILPAPGSIVLVAGLLGLRRRRRD